jgi:serine/threonine protein kinase
MTMWIGDRTLAHLRDVAEWPDLGERYEISGRLGRGGMGAVYSAHDRVLARQVAVKVLDDLHPAADAARLLNEARILGQLEHPGIVPVHDAGTLADGRVFYVMKLVRGERLDVTLPSRGINERLDLFVRICEAVSFAHARGFVHRDLKPQNVMLGPFGEVLVLDWGLATRHADCADDADDADSRPVHVAGTPGYMAPEQEQGARSIDVRVDVYALGVILGSMLIPRAPRALVAIARRACEGDPARRYESVQAMADDVMRFRGGEPVSAHRESIWERLGRLYRRYELPIVLVLVYMLIRAVLLLWSRT